MAAQSASGKGRAKSAKALPRADLPLIDLAGYNQVLAKYRGKPLVVTFWATWCEPCRDEFPLLVQLQKQYAPQGLAIFGVSLDDDSDMNLVRRFIARNQPGFPNYRQKPGIDVDAFYRGGESAVDRHACRRQFSTDATAVSWTFHRRAAARRISKKAFTRCWQVRAAR